MRNKLIILLLLIPVLIKAQESLPGAETCFIKLLNEYRVSKGLDSVKYNQTLYDWSANQSLYLALLNKESMLRGTIICSHDQSIDAKNINEIDRDKIPFKYKNIGENAIVCPPDSITNESIANKMLLEWIESPEHNKNLLTKANCIGVSFYKMRTKAITKQGLVFYTELIIGVMNIGIL